MCRTKRKTESDHFGQGPANAAHEYLFHGTSYYFGSRADVEKAMEIARMCGVDVAWFQDEMDHSGIIWSNGESPGFGDATVKDSA